MGSRPAPALQCADIAEPLSELREELRRNIVAEARSFIGSPFIHQGSVKGVGIDCVQLVRLVYIAAGVFPADLPDQLPYPHGYWKEGVGTRYRDALAPYFDPVAAGERPQPGDLALFQIGQAEAHGAIVVNWPWVIHAYPDQAVMEDDATRNRLGGLRLTSLWRPKGKR